MYINQNLIESTQNFRTGFSGSGFFPGKNQCDSLREVKIFAIMLLLHKKFIFYRHLFGGRSWQIGKMQKTDFI